MEIGYKNKLLSGNSTVTPSRQSIVSGEEGDGFEKSLLGLRGQRWKNVRSTLTPSFTSKKLKQVSLQISRLDAFKQNSFRMEKHLMNFHPVSN